MLVKKSGINNEELIPGTEDCLTQYFLYDTSTHLGYFVQFAQVPLRSFQCWKRKKNKTKHFLKNQHQHELPERIKVSSSKYKFYILRSRRLLEHDKALSLKKKTENRLKITGFLTSSSILHILKGTLMQFQFMNVMFEFRFPNISPVSFYCTVKEKQLERLSDVMEYILLESAHNQKHNCRLHQSQENEVLKRYLLGDSLSVKSFCMENKEDELLVFMQLSKSELASCKMRAIKFLFVVMCVS